MQTFVPIREVPDPQIAAHSIFDLVKPELALVEKEFARQANSNIQVINYLGDYLRSSGGKRMRPALLVLANYAASGDGSSENSIRLATVMEMLHTATLVHDDIIDNADIRRNSASINARYGNQTAVLMGDWLYMSAYETSLRERSLDILDILTQLTRKMTEGELIQLTMIGNLDISEDDYFDILCRKTAYLFSACCEVGAILAGAELELQNAMRDYGLSLGIAFQIVDDLLDVTAEAGILGKAAGSDLIEGKLTLPLIDLLKHDPLLRSKFEAVMLDGRYERFTRDELKNMLLEHGTIELIHGRAKGFAERAKKNLEFLPQTEYRSALEDIPNYVIERRM